MEIDLIHNPSFRKLKNLGAIDPLKLEDFDKLIIWDIDETNEDGAKEPDREVTIWVGC